MRTCCASHQELLRSVISVAQSSGLFGHDGLYAESKIGLETLYWKWASEGWSGRLGIVGAEIGWTKGTGLMSSNDLVAERMESQAGLRTFDSTEMAFSSSRLAAVREQQLEGRRRRATAAAAWGEQQGGVKAGHSRRRSGGPTHCLQPSLIDALDREER